MLGYLASILRYPPRRRARTELGRSSAANTDSRLLCAEEHSKAERMDEIDLEERLELMEQAVDTCFLLVCAIFVFRESVCVCLTLFSFFFVFLFQK